MILPVPVFVLTVLALFGPEEKNAPPLRMSSKHLNKMSRRLSKTATSQSTRSAETTYVGPICITCLCSRVNVFELVHVHGLWMKGKHCLEGVLTSDDNPNYLNNNLEEVCSTAPRQQEECANCMSKLCACMANHK